MTEPFESDPYLRSRYGIAERRSPKWLVTAIAIAVLGGSWLIWTANHFSNPEIRSTLISFREVDAKSIFKQTPSAALKLRTVTFKDLEDTLGIAVGVNDATLLAFVNLVLTQKRDKLDNQKVLNALETNQ
jgi:hypothetical protein